MGAAEAGRSHKLRPGRSTRPGRPSLRPKATAMLAGLLAMAGGSAARAAGVVVEVRVEGRSGTLFEGPVRSEGHDVRATSDTSSRTCDGTNDGRNPLPGATATATTVDAMALAGEDFDGRWFAGIDDYLLTRWGSEAEGEGQSWSLFANNALSDRGGCQLELREGAEVLWKLGFPTAKPLLMLAPQGTSGGAPPLTAEARPGVPFALEVLAYHPSGESEPPAEATRAGASAYAGAKVAPVLTSPSGVETVAEGDPSTVTSNSEGLAAITFTTPGWHRLKAVASGALRSNRLDVCVAEPGEGCGPQPAEDDVRSAAAEPGPSEEAPPAQPPAEVPPRSTQTAPAGSVAAASTTDTLRVDGVTLTPIDDRSRQLHFSGRWRRRPEHGAFDGTLSIGRSGARLAVRLSRGRPAVVLRDVTQGTRVLELVAGRRRVMTLGRLPAGRSKLLLCAPLRSAGAFELRVLSGTLGVDGVGLLA